MIGATKVDLLVLLSKFSMVVEASLAISLPYSAIWLYMASLPWHPHPTWSQPLILWATQILLWDSWSYHPVYGCSADLDLILGLSVRQHKPTITIIRVAQWQPTTDELLSLAPITFYNLSRIQFWSHQTRSSHSSAFTDIFYDFNWKCGRFRNFISSVFYIPWTLSTNQHS